jgi:prolyl-tRNA synthetase
MPSPKQKKTAITPTRADNYPEWYQQVVKAADMAEVSPVRGCMIIKPWGYAIWENMQRVLDKQFKNTGHKNVYFPLLIPLSFMQKEAEHVEGFAKECAVVTHHRLAADAEGKLAPASPLEEPYVIRPTSETIIGEAFSRWIQSYRDLPLLINQWANIVRWEMRTRIFLRTTEFLWQEGHTAHAASEEAMAEAHQMLNIYADFAENYLGIPVIKGEKTASERFPGADHTFCIEAMMQDKKALQAGTSHFLGQHFSKGFNIKFLNAEGKEELAWTTSWGMTTRLIGALIMTHSDDNGLVLPPKIAPSHIVILPIIHQEENRKNILNYCQELKNQLQNIYYHDRHLSIELDQRELPGGEKAWGWVKKGVPIRIEIGMKEVSSDMLVIGQRDKEYHEKITLNKDTFVTTVSAILDTIQNQLFNKAKLFREENTISIDNLEDFLSYFKKSDCGFAQVYWNGDAAIEAKMKQELGITIRCIPFDQPTEPGRCIFTGEASKEVVIFAKAY